MSLFDQLAEYLTLVLRFLQSGMQRLSEDRSVCPLGFHQEMPVYFLEVFQQPNQAPKSVFNLVLFGNGEFFNGIGMADLADIVPMTGVAHVQ